MPQIGLLIAVPPIEPLNGSRAEAEDAAVLGHHPITVTLGARAESADRLVQMLSAHRSVEYRVAKGEHAAIGGRDPITPGQSGAAVHGDAIADTTATGAGDDIHVTGPIPIGARIGVGVAGGAEPKLALQ